MRNVRKVTYVFHRFSNDLWVDSRKVGSLKRRVRSHLFRWEMKNGTPLWREVHLQVKNVQNTPFSDHFWKCRCQKIARRCGAKHIFKSKLPNTPFSDYSWQFRCRKMARPCGRKYMCKSKFTKHTILSPLSEVQMSKKCTPLWREAHFQVKMCKTRHLGPFWEVQMSKNCTPLWREVHFQVKMYKTHHVRTTLGSSDVEKWHAPVAGSTCVSQNLQNTQFSAHFWKFRCHKLVRCCGAKYMCKSKWTNIPFSDHFWKFRCRKNAEPHFQLKMC